MSTLQLSEETNDAVATCHLRLLSFEFQGQLAAAGTVSAVDMIASTLTCKEVNFQSAHMLSSWSGGNYGRFQRDKSDPEQRKASSEFTGSRFLLSSLGERM